MRSTPTPRSALYSLVALLALAVIGLQVIHFDGRVYDHAEDWLVNRTLAQSPGLSSYPVMDGWIALFGGAAPVTRFLSALALALALALLYRLGAELFGWQTGLLAVFLSGISVFIQFFGHEAQPHAAFLVSGIGMMGMFWRWLRSNERLAGALYVVFALLAASLYPWALCLLLAQAVFALLFRRRPLRRVLGLLALAGILAFAAALVSSQAAFIPWQALELARVPIEINPPEFVQALLLLGMAAAVGLLYPIWGEMIDSPQPAGERDSHSAITHLRTKVAYLALPLLVLFGLNPLVPAAYVRLPLLLLALPLLALLAGLTLAALPWPGRWALLVLLALPGLFAFRNFMPEKDYQTIASLVDPGMDSRAVIAAPYSWQHLPLSAYLPLPKERQYHLLLPEQADDLAVLPNPPAQVETAVDEAAVERFMDWIGQAEEVWYFIHEDAPFSPRFELRLRERYAELRRDSWTKTKSATAAYGVWTEYIRIPYELTAAYRFGDKLDLLKWTLQNDVQVRNCQPVTIRSWWQVTESTLVNYSLTLVLADANGQGIVRTDRLISNLESRLWSPQEPQFDERTLTIPCDLAPGEYPLLVGVYILSPQNELTTLPAALPDGALLGDLLYLTTLVVEAP